jgi:hypothetical protein
MGIRPCEFGGSAPANRVGECQTMRFVLHTLMAVTVSAALIVGPAGAATVPPDANAASLPPDANAASLPPDANAASLPPGGTAATVPSGVTAAYAVFDRQSGAFTEQHDVTSQFRSASLVKLLIVLDYLWNRGPGYTIPAADRSRLDPMLRSSDDAAASYYWQLGGYEQVVNRMVTRLGLRNTAPPPVAQRGTWGYTALSVADVVRVYRYLLDAAPTAVRDYVMGNLRQSTRCGTDGYDQSFGIPGSFKTPWTAKQGWSGFGPPPPGPCGGSTVALVPAGVDLVSEALHTSGTVGAGDRSIVVVLTLHPDGTAFTTAAAKLTQLTRSLNVPGGVLAPPPASTGVWFGTWGSGVRVRAEPSTTSAAVATLPAGGDVLVQCQRQGQEVVIDPYRNDWWAYLPDYGGYLTNIYVTSPADKLPGVPDC